MKPRGRRVNESTDPETPAPRPELASVLGMQRHPEGGWFVETWKAAQSFHPDGYPGPRATATAIYFLLAPGETSAWHTVRSDELWLWHRGGPLDLLLGGDGDAPDPRPTVVRLGPAVEDGERPQLLVPGGSWQSARPSTGQEVLVTCVVAPGFDYEDFRLAGPPPGAAAAPAPEPDSDPDSDSDSDPDSGTCHP